MPTHGKQRRRRKRPHPVKQGPIPIQAPKHLDRKQACSNFRYGPQQPSTNSAQASEGFAGLQAMRTYRQSGH
jgi:hypothetical protein